MYSLGGLCMDGIILTRVDGKEVWTKNEEEREVTYRPRGVLVSVLEEHFPLRTLGGGTSTYRMKIPEKSSWGTRAYFDAILIP